MTVQQFCSFLCLGDILAGGLSPRPPPQVLPDQSRQIEEGHFGLVLGVGPHDRARAWHHGCYVFIVLGVCVLRTPPQVPPLPFCFQTTPVNFAPACFKGTWPKFRRLHRSLVEDMRLDMGKTDGINHAARWFDAGSGQGCPLSPLDYAPMGEVQVKVVSWTYLGVTCGTCAQHRTFEYRAISSPHRGQFLDIPSVGRAIWYGGVGTGSVKWVPLDAWKTLRSFGSESGSKNATNISSDISGNFRPRSLGMLGRNFDRNLGSMK